MSQTNNSAATKAFLAGALLLVALSIACGNKDSCRDSASCAGIPAALAEASLRNGTYTIPDLGAVTFLDGKFVGTPVAGSSQGPTVTLVSTAIGDLDGDGASDAVVVTALNGGGTGTFYSLLAVLNKGGKPQQVASEPLGDRIKLNSLSITNGKITVDMVTHGPSDPACCPNLQQTVTYTLKGNALVK